jgi:hypothetical protein
MFRADEDHFTLSQRTYSKEGNQTLPDGIDEGISRDSASPICPEETLSPISEDVNLSSDQPSPTCVGFPRP